MNEVFITFEGPEGAGKTAVIKKLKERLGDDVLFTREPGGIVIAERIREVVLDINHTAMDIRTEALLFAAARGQHYYEKILPALERGKTVICDRFIDSSLVYQGVARGLGVENVFQINRFAIGNRMPDMTILLDIEPEQGLKRIVATRGNEINRFDEETIEFHQMVRQGYLQLAKSEPSRFVVIDAGRRLEEVAMDALNTVLKYV